MTVEELKKEAIKYAVDYPTNYGKGYKHKDLRIAYLAGAEPREKRIAELEKENAELRGLVNQYKASKCGSISLVNRNMIMFDQLTKAKEIINDCMCELQNILFYKMRNKERIASTLDKAEQFLNEVEK